MEDATAKPSMEDPKLARVFTLTFQQLIQFVQSGRLRNGTSAAAGVSQIEIDGHWYEIQMRLEAAPQNFIGEAGVIQYAQIGDTISIQ